MKIELDFEPIEISQKLIRYLDELHAHLGVKTPLPFFVMENLLVALTTTIAFFHESNLFVEKDLDKSIDKIANELKRHVASRLDSDSESTTHLCN